MIKKILILLLFLINNPIKGGTDVYVQNNTPYEFTIDIKQEGKPLEKKHWKKEAHKIIPWRKKIKVLHTARDIGIKKNRRYFFNIILKPKLPNNPKPIILRIQLLGKGIGSGIWKTVNDARWHGDNKVRKYNCKINNQIKCEIFHKFFYKSGSFDDILFVIDTQKPPSEKHYNTKDPSKITILAYNLFNLNPVIKNSPGIMDRSKRIPKAIKEIADPDVIVFSECFDDNGRKEILKGLKKYGYKNSTCIVGAGFHMKKDVFDTPIEQPYIVNFNSSKFKNDKTYEQAGEGDPPSGFFKAGELDGGVIIISKYKIEKAWEIVYKDGAGWDKHAKKGAVYAKINKNGKIYHIFGTHPQASYKNVTEHSDIRKKQFKALKNFIEKMKAPKNEALFVAGDLNIDDINSAGKKELKEVLKELDLSLPKKIGYPYSAHDVKTNCFFSDNRSSRYLDYILFSNKHIEPSKATTEVLIPKTKTPWSSWEDARFDLSDHYPVLGYFEFPTANPVNQ